MPLAARRHRHAGGGRSRRPRGPSARRCRRGLRRGLQRRHRADDHERAVDEAAGPRRRRRRRRGSCRGGSRRASDAGQEPSCWAAAWAQRRSGVLRRRRSRTRHAGPRRASAPRPRACVDRGPTTTASARAGRRSSQARVLDHERLDEARRRIGREPAVVDLEVSHRRLLLGHPEAVDEPHSCWPIHHVPPASRSACR